MLRAHPRRRRLTQGLRGSTILSVTVVLAGWLALTACNQEPSAPAQNDKAMQGSTGNADLFSDMNNNTAKKPAAPPPQNDAMTGGSKGPGAAAAPPPLVPVLDPAVAAECKSLREQEKALREKADQQREKRVAPATEAFEKAYESFDECQQDFGCANNEGRYASLGTAAKRAEKAMEVEEETLMKIEGELHDVSQKISIKCGDF